MAMNEVGRALITVPATGGWGGLGDKYIAVAVMEEGGRRHLELVQDVPNYAYSIVSWVCQSRAVSAVRGELLVNGQEIEPEKYLQLWRTALVEPLSGDEALKSLGVEVKLVARGNAVKQAGLKRRWTTDPEEGWDGWVKRLGAALQWDEEGRFEVAFDIREEGAFEAWHHIESYRSEAAEEQRHAGVRLDVITPPKEPVARGQQLVGIESVDCEQQSLFA